MSYTSRLVTRAELGWGNTRASRAACVRGLVLHYDGSDQNLRNRSHSACVEYWRRTRSFHVNTRGWLDIGYSFGACPHGYILTGRGINRSQAAQPGGNSTYHSCTTMGGPGEPLTTDQIGAIQELHEYLHDRHGVARVQKCHSDFISTSCPGDVVRRMVRRGDLLPGSGSPPPSDNSGSDWMGEMVRKLPVVGKGDTGEFVQNVQALCQARSHPEVKIDGDFGDVTQKAVKSLQRWGKVADDGIVGPNTWPVLLRVH